MELHHVRRGSGEPLVLVHGIGDSHRGWTRVLDRLARERECWAIDLPGFGLSPPLADDAPATPAGLAATVVGWMRGQGHDAFHIAGNSLGGGIALEIARSGHARSVCALSPIGFAAGLEVPLLYASLQANRSVAKVAPKLLSERPLARRVSSLQSIARADTMSPDEHRALVRRLARAPGWRRTLPHVVGYRFRGPLPDVPVTVAWGELDRLLPFRPQSARARAALPGARHVTLHGCSHLPMWDDPEQVARVVLAASGG